ncbi:MAG: FAD-dependent monooxygenase [Sphingomonadaceae bacterium]|nr:FAD-dependent monooxygenase [Sphingomonadaceae bacterium]
MSVIHPVLIVGAGPTGLTTAVELTRQGVPVRIIDMVPQRGRLEGRALGTFARTQEIFERIGLGEKMYDTSFPVEAVHYYYNGRKLGQLAMHGLESPYPFSMTNTQPENERILIELLADHGVKVERPVELKSFTAASDHVDCVLVHEDGRDETMTCSFLAACDGGRSTVRKQLGEDFSGVQLQGEYLLDFKAEWDTPPPPQGVTYFSYSDDTLLIMTLLRSGYWRMAISMDFDDPRVKPDLPPVEELQKLVDIHKRHFAFRIGEIAWSSAFWISNRMVPNFRHGRVILMGDAAHIHSPVGGQGQNNGIGDGYNLAWKLAHFLKGVGGEALLDSYEAERKPVIADVLKATEQADKMSRTRHWFWKRARNAFVKYGTRRPGVQKMFREMLAGYREYKNGPLNAEYDGYSGKAISYIGGFPDYAKSDKAPKPGLCATDAHGVGVGLSRKRSRLFEVLNRDGTKHVLLVFTGIQVTDERRDYIRNFVKSVNRNYNGWVRAYMVAIQYNMGEDEDTIIDYEAQAHIRYGAFSDCFFLIRPDLYVAMRCRPADEGRFDAYMDKHFPAIRTTPYIAALPGFAGALPGMLQAAE